MNKLLPKLTAEFIEGMAKERGITLPILVDANGIKAFMNVAYAEGHADSQAELAQVKAERDALQAKLDAIEKQEPFCYKYEHDYIWGGKVITDLPTYNGGQRAIRAIPLYTNALSPAAPKEGEPNV